MIQFQRTNKHHFLRLEGYQQNFIFCTFVATKWALWGLVLGHCVPKALAAIVKKRRLREIEDSDLKVGALKSRKSWTHDDWAINH